MLLFVNAVTGQQAETDPGLKAEISKLSFIQGEWSGSGWMMGRDGQKHSFNQTEKVQFKLDQTLLLIEGQGKSDGEIIHDALAAVTFDKESGKYSFQSWLASGRSGSFPAELIDGKFYWYPNDYIRYILHINSDGQWYETGEMNRGGNWVQFFQMILDKH